MLIRSNGAILVQQSIQALQSTAAFAGVTDASLAFLLERSRTVTVPAGHLFFREHERGDTFYLIEEGSVGIFKTRGDVRRDLGELGEGDCFGEMALLSVTTRSATVVALEPCVCLELSNRALLELYREDVGQFALVVMNLGREVCRRLRDLNERLLNQACEQAARRAAEQTDGLEATAALLAPLPGLAPDW